MPEPRNYVFALLFTAVMMTVSPSWLSPAYAKSSLSVLFVGNSHLRMPGFMPRVERRLRARYALRRRVVAKIGWTLSRARKQAATRQALRSQKWDVVVLQESTTAFMTKHGRRSFAATVRWFQKNKPAGTKLVIWQPWPQGATHALYRRAGVWGKWFKNPPKNPKQLFSWISQTTARVAKANAARIAPIGRCWTSLPRAKQPYAQDDYHASGRGLTFIARILSKTIVAAKSGAGSGGC